MGVIVYEKQDHRGTRPTWYFNARTKTGWIKRSSGIPLKNKRLAVSVATMWETLAFEHRAWDVLDRVLSGGLEIGQLFDHWEPAHRRKHDLPYLRRALADRNALEQLEEFLVQYRGTVKPDTLVRTEFYLRKLLPEGATTLVSELCPEFLARQFATLGVKGDGNPFAPATKRVMHSAWSDYCAWLVRPQQLLDRNPMADVDKPAQKRSEAQFYELDDAQRIIAAQPTQACRAFFALVYGGAIEPGVAIALKRSDFDPVEKDVRARGTKTHSRDWQSMLADWAWGIVWAYVKTVPDGEPVFGSTTQSTMTHWHRDTVVALHLAPEYPLYNGRHHWAATRMRADVPVEIVSQQLGHSSTQETLLVYGKFRPSAADRRAAERSVAAYEKKRRMAAEALVARAMVPPVVPLDPALTAAVA